MSRAIAFYLLKLAAIAFAIHWSTISMASAADGDSDRCTAVRRHCENGEATCSWLRNALKEDGITCPGVDAPPSPSDVLVGPVTDEEYAGRCKRALAACRDGDAVRAKWRAAFNEHGSVCPGVNAPPSALMKGPSAPKAVVVSTNNKLQEFYGLCAPHVNSPLSSAIPCMKALVTASQDPIFNDRDPAMQLYLLEADDLLAKYEHRQVSESVAREKLLHMLLDLEERHRPQVEAQLAREASAQALLQQQEMERLRQAAEARARKQADAEAAQRAQDQESQRADQQVALERLTLQCKAVMGSMPGGFNIGRVVMCDSDPYAHLRPENRPQPS